MDENRVQLIRKSTRDLLQTQRKNNRVEQADTRRTALKKPRAREDIIIQSIINKLKTRDAVRATELRTLKNALIDYPEYVKLVMSSHGTLRGIIRELTGLDVKKHSEAAGCLCNLALGDSRTCNTIAKFAGTYLLTCLDCLNAELVVITAWVIGNLAGSGPKVCEVLAAQGVLSKLIEHLANPNEHILEACGYAITHFVYQMKDQLSKEHLEKLMKASTLNKTPAQLKFLLSCHSNFRVSEPFLQNHLNTLSTFIHSENQIENITDFLHCVRTLANICAQVEFCEIVVKNVIENDFAKLLEKVSHLNNETLNSSVHWFLGNLLKYSTDNVFKEKFLNNILK